MHYLNKFTAHVENTKSNTFYALSGNEQNIRMEKDMAAAEQKLQRELAAAKNNTRKSLFNLFNS